MDSRLSATAGKERLKKMVLQVLLIFYLLSSYTKSECCHDDHHIIEPHTNWPSMEPTIEPTVYPSFSVLGDPYEGQVTKHPLTIALITTVALFGCCLCIIVICVLKNYERIKQFNTSLRQPGSPIYSQSNYGSPAHVYNDEINEGFVAQPEGEKVTEMVQLF